MSEQKILDFFKAIMRMNNSENVANANFERGMKALNHAYRPVYSRLDEEINKSSELNNKDKS